MNTEVKTGLEGVNLDSSGQSILENIARIDTVLCFPQQERGVIDIDRIDVKITTVVFVRHAFLRCNKETEIQLSVIIISKWRLTATIVLSRSC